MTGTSRPLSPLGELLEAGRNSLGISAREAARRAKISEGRWRQIVTGVQSRGGVDQRVGTPLRTVVVMARAVSLDPFEAVRVAGFNVSPDTVSKILLDLTMPPRTSNAAVSADELAAEIERANALPLPAAERLRIIRVLMALAAEAETEGIERPSA